MTSDAFDDLIRDARKADRVAALRDAAELLMAADAGDDDGCNAVWNRCKQGPLAGVLVQECIRLAREIHGKDLAAWLQSFEDRAAKARRPSADVIPLRKP